MKMRKVFSFLLAICLTVGVMFLQVPQAQAAQTLTSGTTGDLAWALSDEGIFTLTGEGYMADYESAGDVPWHSHAAQIKAISIGANVRSIGDYAFANCVNLQSALIPEKVLSMGYGAFADSGLENIYVYSRGMKFVQVNYADAVTLPVDCVVHGYESTDAHNYCGRNERNFELMTEGFLFTVNSGNSTFPMARGADEYRIADMWKASTAADGSDGSILLDYTLTVDADELQETYNNMQANSSYLIGDEYYNNGHLDIEIHFSLAEGYEGTSFSCGASYGYSERDMKGNENKDYHKWHTYSNTPYLTMTSDGTKLYIHVDATIKNLYDSVMAQRAEDGDPTEFRPERFYFHVIARGETYKYNSYYVDKSIYIDSEHQTIFDSHRRDSGAEAEWMLTMDRVLTVEDWPYYEGNPSPEELAKFYEPVSRHYVWGYAISREGYFYDEETETDIYPGNCFWDLEGDGMATEVYNGVLYGGVRGTYDAGSDNAVSLRDILPADHEAFVETLKGVEATGFGGEVRIDLFYTLTLTFADGTEVVLEGGVADEGTMIAGVCLHTCQVCGMCTSNKLLACNSQYGHRTNECACETPSPSVESTSVDNAQVIADQSFCYYGDVTAVVETFDVEMAVTTDYYKAVTQDLGSQDVLAVYDITLYDEWGNAITINEWGGTDEYVTIQIPVSAEIAAAAVEGLLDLYHVDKNGVAELVPITVDTVNNILTFKSYQFSPFVLVKKPASIYYGRSQLAKMPKASALLYAYDQIVEGVENCADSISVYNGSTYLTAGEIAAVWDTYTRDYAHHFWLGLEWSYGYNEDGVVSVLPTYSTYFMTGTNLETARAKFEAEAAEILSGISASMSDYEKELYLHDELASRIVYAESTNAHNAYGALVDGVAVCEGYAEALQYLLHQVDIPSFLITGSSNNPVTGTPVGHKWNAVQIDGKWYQVDLTWDDQGEELYHAYFNITTTRLQEDHLIESASVALPVCSSEAAFFFTGEDTLLETYDVATVGKLLKDNGYHVHVYVPGDVEAFVNWYNNNIGTLASQAGIPYYMGFSCAYATLGHEVCLELIPVCSHTNKTETAAKAATCEDPGNNKYYTCNECHTVLKADGTTKTTVEAETLAPLGHDLADATCDAPAKCKRDGCDYTEGAALGHDEIPHEAKAPTCTEIGWDAYVTCSRCTYTTYAEKPVLDHDMKETTAAVAPDCVNPGKEAIRTCTRCGHTDGGDPVDALGHDLAAATCDVPAKCKRDGCDYTEGAALGHDLADATCDAPAKCKRDGCDYTEGTALGHSMQVTAPAVEPDCENPGKTAFLTCTRCGHTEGGDPVDAKGHDLAEATCDAPAKCKRDGCDYTEGAALGHSYETAVTPPSCTSQGYTTYTCADCGYSYKADYKEETGHTAEPIPGVEPGCTSTGLTEGSKCAVCGDILTSQEIIPALDHTPVTIPGYAATCSAPGLTDGSKCGTCGDILAAQEEIPVLDHVAEVVPGYAATCTAPGKTDGSKCSACGTTLAAQEEIPVLDHVPETVTGYAATCTAPGKTDGSKCSACGTTLTAQEEIPMLDHDMQETEAAVTPGCETYGKTAVLTCSMCGKTEGGISVDPTGHDWTDGTCTNCSTACEHSYDMDGVCTVCGSGCVHDYEAETTDPTCTEQGYTTYTCKVCEYSYKGDYKDPLDHSWQDATCTEAKKCIRCGITDGDPKGHNYTTEVTAPTCTAQGYTTHTCTGCGDVIVDNYTPVTEHTAGVPVEKNRVEATCTQDGSYDSVTCCTGCGTELSSVPNVIPAKGHSNEDALTAPNCTEQGYTTHTCTVCGDVTVDNYTPATGHTPAGEPVIENKTEDGWDEVVYCTVCEEELSRKHIGGGLLGDANGDGEVDNIDAMLIARYDVGLTAANKIHLEACDVNGDGEVDNIDAMLVARYDVGFTSKYPIGQEGKD